jgi:hypothetical protein
MLDYMAFRRCDSKATYRNGKIAATVARKVSQRIGELVIAYECFECGCWHIGHADQAQLNARTPVSKASCRVCWQPIPEHKVEQAKYCKTKPLYCSKSCSKRARKQRKEKASE